MHLQICRFCWNKIRTEGSGNCPACRSPYAENPADFKPLTAEELARIKAEKRQKDHAKKQKISENRCIFRLLLAYLTDRFTTTNYMLHLLYLICVGVLLPCQS